MYSKTWCKSNTKETLLVGIFIVPVAIYFSEPLMIALWLLALIIARGNEINLTYFKNYALYLRAFSKGSEANYTFHHKFEAVTNCHAKVLSVAWNFDFNMEPLLKVVNFLKRSRGQYGFVTVNSENWKQDVTEMIQYASFVIVDHSVFTENIKWEVEQTLLLKKPDKIIALTGPDTPEYVKAMLSSLTTFDTTLPPNEFSELLSKRYGKPKGLRSVLIKLLMVSDGRRTIKYHVLGLIATLWGDICSGLLMPPQKSLKIPQKINK